jgi:hypothetical protein
MYVLTVEFDIKTEHFKAFDRTVAPWIAAKAVRIYERLDPG